MKKIFAIIMICMMMLIMSACNNISSEMPIKDLPEYPEVDLVDGYSISGKVEDLKGNGLVGAAISVNGVVMAITDDLGEYSIKSLTEDSRVAVSFYDYEFKNDTRMISSYTKDLDFKGNSLGQFKVTAKATTMNGAGLFGVSYNINGDPGVEDSTGVAYSVNNDGKTTIIPSKEGFTFYPKSVDLYTGNDGDPFIFTAIPNEDTFSVSGTLTFIDDSAFPEVFIYVNGVKHTNTVIATQDNSKKITYTVSGLPDTDGVGYVISTGYGYDGYMSTTTNYRVNAERSGVDFDMVQAKTTSVTLEFAQHDPARNVSYYIIVSDARGNEVKRYDFNNRGKANGVVVFEGCKIEVVSRGGDFSSDFGRVSQSFMDNPFAKNINIDCSWD